MPQRDSPSFTLDPLPEVITFDCYGTLVQWHEVLLGEISETLRAHDTTTAKASAILDSFSAQSRKLTAEKPHRSYTDVLRIGFAAAFNEHGLRPEEKEIERIAASPMRMGPHPDVPPVLARLRERYKLAIFTNSDDDLISPTVERINVPFDYVITAQQAQAYKPSRQLFDYGYRMIGATPDETVHVAMGMYTDMKARHELDLRGIWVNRRGEVGNSEWLPYSEVRDLEGVAALLLPASR